jgi:hypothetical protein
VLNLAYLAVSWLAYFVELFLAYFVMQIFAFPQSIKEAGNLLGLGAFLF